MAHRQRLFPPGRARPASMPGHAAALAAMLAAWLAGCAGPPPAPEPPPLRPAEARALVLRALPAQTADAAGWATDVYAALASLDIPATPQTLCAALAVAEQESGFRADPAVPGLGAIARREIDRRAEAAGIPLALVHAALALDSPNGKSYAERIAQARTERELSDTFEDFIGMVPLGRRLFASYNPVRTGGPMQVAIRFAEEQAAAKPYPYPLAGSIRQEVFTRRGGLYFGIAHLLDYAAPTYDQPLYRFADFNAGRLASRNAALQNAIRIASGVPLDLDGDLVRGDGSDGTPGSTELAARVLAGRLDMSARAIRRDLEQGHGAELERTRLYERTFALAETIERRPLPRAVLPRIALKSPKITRPLTTEWFARRVDERYRRCLARGAGG